MKLTVKLSFQMFPFADKGLEIWNIMRRCLGATTW
jgi:hypothetical protein